MRVLILKISSLGDVIHTLPALSDAQKAIPGIQFDWVVEEAFNEIPTWHPAVNRVITIAHRRWRKDLLRTLFSSEFKSFIQEIRAEDYDLIIDAQGQLLKNTWLAYLAKGRRVGMDWQSVREPVASLFYQQKINIPKGQHAVERLRQLFAHSLGYNFPMSTGHYGIDREQRFHTKIDNRRLMFLHGTSWITKEWPVTYWAQLIELAAKDGYSVRMTWGDPKEKDRAETLAKNQPHVRVLDKLDLQGIGTELAACAGVIAVDTGLCHLSAALNIPTLSLYGPTSSTLTGAYGESQHYLNADYKCSPCLLKQCNLDPENDIHPPCFTNLPPKKVWQEMMGILDQNKQKT